MEIPKEELDFELTILSGQVFRWRKLEDGSWLGADGDNWYRVDGSTVESNASEAAFRNYFRLDQSLSDIEKKVLKKGSEVAPCFESLRGLRVLAPSDPEEIFFCFLCTPNNNVERITKMVRTLESYGDSFQSNHRLTQMDRDGAEESVAEESILENAGIRRFPNALRIAEIPEAELRAKNFGYRGKSIPYAAKSLIERGPEWLNSLKKGSYREAHDELCQIRGIGPKLADCICLFGLHFTEAVPVDTHLWQAACREYFPEWAGGSMTGKRYREIGDLFRSKFGKLAGWAHQYLFLDNMLRRRGGAASRPVISSSS